MQHFIGRKRELHVLEAEYAKPSSFVVIYGRRRVGKTTLIKEFIKDKQALYFCFSPGYLTMSFSKYMTI